MPLDFTEYYRLRKPKATDGVDIPDFNRFFSGNPDIIDAELHRLSEALDALDSRMALLEDGGGSAASSEEITALQASFQSLRTYVNGFADRIAELETNGGGSGSEPVDLSGLNAAIASVQQTIGNYGTRISVLEQGGIPTTTIEAINDALSDVRRTLSGYGGRIESLEGSQNTVDLTPLESRMSTLESSLSIVNGMSGRVSNLETGQASINLFAGRLDALETLTGSLSGRMNSLAAAIDELENISGIADTTALSNRISALGNEISAAMTLLSNRIAVLETSAFADMREGADGYWYAYNKSGVQVDGPLRMGYLNGGRTWADVFEVAATPDPAPEPSPAPRTWAQVFGITA